MSAFLLDALSKTLDTLYDILLCDLGEESQHKENTFSPEGTSYIKSFQVLSRKQQSIMLNFCNQGSPNTNSTF